MIMAILHDFAQICINNYTHHLVKTDYYFHYFTQGTQYSGEHRRVAENVNYSRQL